MSATVATADEVEALRAKLERLVAEVAELRSGVEREMLSPKEIAKRLTLRAADVYAACASGALIAEIRPGRNSRGFAYGITMADARAWRAAVRVLNQ